MDLCLLHMYLDLGKSKGSHAVHGGAEKVPTCASHCFMTHIWKPSLLPRAILPIQRSLSDGYIRTSQGIPKCGYFPKDASGTKIYIKFHYFILKSVLPFLHTHT